MYDMLVIPHYLQMDQQLVCIHIIVVLNTKEFA